MGFLEVFVRRPVFTTMLIASLVVLGVASFVQLGVDIFPKVDLPTITITTRLPGASPEDRKSTRLNSSHIQKSRMPSSA